MARRNRRKYTPEQKADAVRLVREVGNVAKVARDLEIHETTLHHWVKQADIDEGRALAGVIDLCVDPEGRYVALLTDSQKLYRIPASPGATPTLILDGNDGGLPSHAPYIDLYLRPYLHSTGVRVVVVGTMLLDGGVLALWDTDNDGNMDLITDEELGSDLDMDPTAFSLELSEDYGRAF